jgi:DNA polymerase III delta prime subunit
MRYELKLFCQTPSSRFRKKKILILDDIQVFSDNMQKLIVNNIDKWSDNINIIITSKSIYSVDQSLSSRVVPINIPNIHKEILKKNILSVCEKESVNISPVGIDYILKINENNILALLNNLHKCKLLQTYDSIIDLDTLRKCCTLINDTDFNMYIDLCKNKKIMESYELLLTFINNGYSVMDILNEFYHYVKISENIDEEHKYKLFKIISDFIINFITIHEEELELLIFSYDISNVLYI